MKNLFNVENPVWVFMGKLVDMLILSGLWVICSLPVVTIGASTAALYYVTLKLANNEEGYTVRSFFHAFKENLIPGIPLGIGALAVGIFLGCDIYMYSQLDGKMGIVLLWAVIVLLALLSLGVKNIHLGPTLPAFLSPNVAKVLVDNFGIAGIGSVEEDMKLFFGPNA